MVKKDPAKGRSASGGKIEILKKFTQELLDQLGQPVTFGVEEKKEVININLQTDNPGIFIGYHGQTLASIQLILSMMVYRKLGEWVKLVVDVGDYRLRRAEALGRIALSAAQKVKFSGQEYELPSMSSAERREIHLALAENPEVETESTGEGRDRRVVVKPRKTG